MSTPVIPVVPPQSEEAEKVNAPQPDSERAAELRRERDEALAEGELPPADISGIAEQGFRGDKTKKP